MNEAIIIQHTIKENNGEWDFALYLSCSSNDALGNIRTMIEKGARNWALDYKDGELLLYIRWGTSSAIFILLSPKFNTDKDLIFFISTFPLVCSVRREYFNEEYSDLFNRVRQEMALTILPDAIITFILEEYLCYG